MTPTPDVTWRAPSGRTTTCARTWPHDDVRPYVAARLADVGARAVLDVGGGTGKLARLLPGLPMRCLCTTTAIRARHRGSPSRTHGRPRPRWTCRWH